MERSVYPVYIAGCTFLPGTNQVLVINQLSLSFPDILPSISGVQSGNRSPPIVDCLVRETNRQIATIKSTAGRRE